MSALDPLHPLQSAIIETLADQKGLRVKDLYFHLEHNLKFKVSRQNLYRQISQLIDAGILMKEGSQIYLSWEWIARFLQLADAVKLNYAEQDNIGQYLPEQIGEKAELTADSLMSLDLIWFDALFSFLSKTKNRDWYVYNSHPWYAVCSLETEKRFFERLLMRGVEVSMIYGNDNFLDQYGLELISLSGFKSIISTSTKLKSEGYALWVCTPYLLEVNFPESVNQFFAYLFSAVKTMEQFNPETISQVFKMKSSCSLTIEYNPKKAERLRKKLKKQFNT